MLLVKENQPELYRSIALLFDPPATLAALPLLDRREVRTVDRGHGRQQDARHLVASTDLTGYLDWPDLAQVFRLERTWRQHGGAKRELHYGSSSLSPTAGPPARLLDLKRGHWPIENGRHRVKDVTLGEDQSTLHKGQGPTVMAMLRDAALNLLRRAGIHQIAARLPAHSQNPATAIALVLAAPPPHTRA